MTRWYFTKIALYSRVGNPLVRQYDYTDKDQAHSDLVETLRVEFPFNRVERKGDQYFITGKLVAEIEEDEE